MLIIQLIKYRNRISINIILNVFFHQWNNELFRLLFTPQHPLVRSCQLSDIAKIELQCDFRQGKISRVNKLL